MTFSNFFLGFSASLAFLFAIGEFFSAKSKSRNWYLGCVFLFLANLLFQSFLWSSGLLMLYPHFLQIHIPTTVLMGPFLERYLVLVWENEFESFKRFIIKCCISLSLISIMIPLYLKSSVEKIFLIEDLYKNGLPIRSKITIFLVMGIMSYFLLSLLFRFKKLFRSSTFFSSPTLILILSVLIIGFASISIGGLYTFFGSHVGLETNGYLFGFFLILLYILRIKNPEIFQEIQKIVEEEKKYKNSQLKSIDLKSVAEKLKKLFEIDKIYREDNLNLTELATQIGISNHQLSEYLNQEAKLSFFQLINKYRIKEAEERLLTNKDETILSIAYQVGYQSKSSFNDIFKKETGLTPTEYRKKARKRV